MVTETENDKWSMVSFVFEFELMSTNLSIKRFKALMSFNMINNVNEFYRRSGRKKDESIIIFCIKILPLQTDGILL